MKVFCGTDIIEICRIRKSLEDEKTGTSLKERIFTPQEIAYCESKKNQKYQHYAARFAAKEAAFKALSKQIENKYSILWKDFEVVNDEQGRPELRVLNNLKTSIQNIDLSISRNLRSNISRKECLKYGIFG